MTTPCGTTERSIRSTAGMCGQECAKPGCVSRSAWTRPSRCSSRGAMCACGAASRRSTEWRRPKRRRQSPHVRPASPKKRALGWRTSLSGLAHLCTRLSRYPMLVGEHRCPRPKTKGAPGKSGPAIFALKISEDRCSRASPKQICPQNQNPQNGHLMARFDWGLGAVCFGANPVAAVFGSAPGSATPPEHRIHFKPTSQEALLKQDISTLLGIGHFYFALTTGRHNLANDMDFSYTWATQVWTHTVIARTGSTVTLYINGAPIGTASTSASFGAGDVILANCYNGISLDEYRVSNGVARSANWIATEYNNQHSPGNIGANGSWDLEGHGDRSASSLSYHHPAANLRCPAHRLRAVLQKTVRRHSLRRSSGYSPLS